jgi:3-oxoacyl-[acyl-carrier protein] reductase
MADLSGQAVLITGASTGIGAASARLLARAGADIGVHYLRSAAAARQVARQVEAAGRRALVLKADVRRPAQVDRMVGRFLEVFGRMDVLFANAGGLVRRSPIHQASDALWREVFALNADSVFYTVRAALRAMLPKKYGHIIINASVAARTGGGGGSVPYAAAKGALVSFTRGLALEVAAQGIRVNAIAPGVTDTPFHEKYTEPERMKAFRQKMPLRKIGAPEDIARAVVWLAGEGGGFITGETIHLAGGV